MTLPEAIFWDWDGTLADTVPFLRTANNHVRHHLGLPDQTDEEFVEILRYSTNESYERAYSDRAKEAMDVLYAFVEENHSKGLEPISGATDILKFCHDLEIPMAVVSNKRPRFLHEQIDYFNWGHYFDFAIGAGEADKDKPAADPILMARDMLDKSIDTKDIWYVGDSETDLNAARNAGCPCIFIQNKGEEQAFLSEYEPLKIIENYTEFREFLLQNR